MIGSTEGALPAAFEKRTVWPDGSLQWVWVDFQGRTDQDFEMTIGQRPANLPTPGIQVTTNQNRVVVSNGLLALEWDKQFATPVGVRVVGDDGKSAPLATGDGRGIYLINQDGRRATLGGPGSELRLEVESSNRLRAVVRVEGWYVYDDGTRAARGVVRYDIAWKQPGVKLDHTFIVTRDNDELWYREIGVTLPLDAGAPSTVRFGLRDQPPFRAERSAAEPEVYVYQDRYPLYYKPESHCSVGVGARTVAEGSVADGWSETSSGTARLFLAVRDFSPQFPKELTATADGLTAKLWSGRDGRVLDYKPSTLADDWWGAWLDRLDYSRDQVRLKEAMAESGKPDPRVYTTDGIRKLNPSCVGVARTHSLLFAYGQGDFNAAQAAELNALANKPPVVQPEPAWMMHVDPRIVTPMIAQGEGGPQFEPIERGIDAWIDELQARRKAFPYAGWYEWGKHSNLLYEKSAEGEIYAQWYRLTSVNYYHYNCNMMLIWMRTADRRYLDEAEQVNRWLADNHYIHADGGKGDKKLGNNTSGNARAPVYWEGSGGLAEPSTEALTGFAYEYLLRDDRRLKDALELATGPLLTELDIHRYYETADMLLMKLCALYRVSQDPQVLDLMRRYVRVWTDPESATGLNTAYWKSEKDAVYKSHRKAFMLLQYYDLTRDDYVVPIIVKLAIAMFDHYGERYTQPFYYQHRLGGLGARVYQWTGDPDMLFWARHQVDGATEVFLRHETLPPEKKGYRRGMEAKGPSEVYGTYIFNNVKFQADWMPGRGMLYFNGDSTPAILSLPIAINVLKDVPQQK
jgi:hypothetical protein